MAKRGEYKKNAKPDSVRQRKYNGSEEQKKNRASRNAARRAAIKEHGKQALKGKDIDHQNMNPKDNRKSNLKVMDKSKNRAKNQWAKRKRQ